MSKIIENFLLPLFVIISVLYAFNSFGSDDISINKVYHHLAQDDAYIERAKLSIYFSGEPQVQEMNKSVQDGSSCAFSENSHKFR